MLRTVPALAEERPELRERLVALVVEVRLRPPEDDPAQPTESPVPPDVDRPLMRVRPVVVALVLDHDPRVRVCHVDPGEEPIVFVVDRHLEVRFGQPSADDPEARTRLLRRTRSTPDEVECSTQAPRSAAPSTLQERGAEVVDIGPTPALRDDRVAEDHEVVELEQCTALHPGHRRCARRDAPPVPNRRAWRLHAVAHDADPPRLRCRQSARDVERPVAVGPGQRELPEQCCGRVTDELSGQEHRPERPDAVDALRWTGALPPDRPGRPDEVPSAQPLAGHPHPVRRADVERAVADRRRECSWLHDDEPRGPDGRLHAHRVDLCRTRLEPPVWRTHCRTRPRTTEQESSGRVPAPDDFCSLTGSGRGFGTRERDAGRATATRGGGR